MEFVSKCKIMGVAHFHDSIDGKDIDSGTIFIEEALDESSGRSKGFRAVEYKTPDHVLAKALLHNAFPLMAEVTFMSKVTKGSQSLSIVSVKPVQFAPTQKAA